MAAKKAGKRKEKYPLQVNLKVARPEWIAVDEYFGGLLAPGDAQLDAALKANQAAGLPAIDVSPLQGKFLHVLVQIVRPRRVLEIGTLGGYSTIWIARALSRGGRITSLEYNPKHAEVARGNLENAGLLKRVEIRVGRALDSLPALASEGAGPFDLIFIDADKKSNPQYLEWALKLARVGTVIVVDNVVRDGKVVDAKSADPDIRGTRRMASLMAREPRLSATVVQNVGVKGYDGFAIGVVVS
jgi:predicted O-methyltransferase YrrM